MCAPCGRIGCALPLRYILRVKIMKYIPELHIFRCASDLGTRIIRKPRIPGARVCLFTGSAVNNIVKKAKIMTKDTKNGSKLYFKILKNVEKLGIDSHYLNPIPIFEDFISHSQWPNPSPSNPNPIFPV